MLYDKSLPPKEVWESFLRTKESSKIRKNLPRNIPKELFTWAPPKTTDWVKEHIETHLKNPIYKIKLKYLEYIILSVSGPYYVKGYPLYSRTENKDDPTTTQESLWEVLTVSLRNNGLQKPVRVHQLVNDKGEIHWRVLNGNHRCNVLLDMYGPEYEVDCSLEWTREKHNPNKGRYINNTNTHMSIKNHINIHRPATKEDNRLFREKINEEVMRRIHNVTGSTVQVNPPNRVNKTYKDYQ